MGIPLRRAKEALIKLPNATNYEIAKRVGVSPRTVASARAALVATGVFEEHRRTKKPEKEEISEKIAKIPLPEATPGEETEIYQPELIGGRTLQELIDDDNLEDLENDEETRKRLLKIIKNIAFNSKTHPDTRITAIQAWTKLRDIAKTKELGPGLPLTEGDVLTRLVRINIGVGPRLAIKAMELAFSLEKDTNASQTQNIKDSTSVGTEETPIPS